MYYILFFTAQSQMMAGRAGAFYSPFHSMWGFSNTSSQKYSGLGSASSGSGAATNSNNFGYPPTPPKDSGTPEGQPPLTAEEAAAGAAASSYGGGHQHPQHMNNNNVVSSPAETKPSTEHLMNSISSLSAYAGLPQSNRKLPEGTNSQNSQYSSPTTDGASAAAASMFYCYPTSSDLAMYGSNSYGSRALQNSRPKSKNRSNAGKQCALICLAHWRVRFSLELQEEMLSDSKKITLTSSNMPSPIVIKSLYYKIF